MEPNQNTVGDDKSESISVRTERALVRLTFWQTILSVVGIIIAIVALYAALTESAAVRQQTEASVWPFVQFSVSDHDDEDSASFTLSFTNAGVGPARMGGLKLTIADTPVKDWRHAVELVGGSTDMEVYRSFIVNRVIRPEETVNLFGTESPALARLLQQAMQKPGSSIAYCYCSIFDACWLADSNKNVQIPEAVESCPDFGEAKYRH